MVEASVDETGALGPSGPRSDDAPRGRRRTSRVAIVPLVREVIRAVDQQNLPMVAGGLAFFAMLSGAPLLLALVSIYGLLADPSAVEAQVKSLAEILPDEARTLVAEQLYDVVGLSVEQLELGAVASVVGGLWGGSKGTFYLFRALNLAYGRSESRRLLRVKAMALAFTLLIIVSSAVVLGLVAVLPGLLGLVGLDEHAESLIEVGRWPAVAALALLVLALLYRFGPDRRAPQWRWVTTGSVTAVFAWLVLSFLFSLYVAKFGEFNEVYGSLAAVIILLLWLYLSAFLILLGAVIDAVIDAKVRAQDVRGIRSTNRRSARSPRRRPRATRSSSGS